MIMNCLPLISAIVIMLVSSRSRLRRMRKSNL